MLDFLKLFYGEVHITLINYMENEKDNFILQLGTMSLLFRCLIVPFWTIMAKTQRKSEYLSNIADFRSNSSMIIESSNPVLKVLEIPKFANKSNVYKLVGLAIQEQFKNGDSLLTENKLLVRNCITECIKYLDKIKAGQELNNARYQDPEAPAEEHNDVVLSTNVGIERKVGLFCGIIYL
jgi:hypothetical protein